MRAVERWAPLAKAYISFGQGLSVTALQLANAFAAVGNGGKLAAGPIVVASVGPDATAGSSRAAAGGDPQRRVARQPALARAHARRRWCSKAPARRRESPAITVAGKTGTAQKAMPGGYSPDKFVASFVGFAPARNPVIAGVVVIDEPRSAAVPRRRRGGAGVRRGRARGVALAFGVAPSRDTPEAWPYERLPDDESDIASESVMASSATAPIATGPRIPDWIGSSARTAYYAALQLGLKPVLRGHGFVVAQAPAPGSSLVTGQTLVLELSLQRESPSTSRPTSTVDVLARTRESRAGAVLATSGVPR